MLPHLAILRVVLWHDWAEVVVGDGHHDAPRGGVRAPGALSAVSGEGLVGPAGLRWAVVD